MDALQARGSEKIALNVLVFAGSVSFSLCRLLSALLTHCVSLYGRHPTRSVLQGEAQVARVDSSLAQEWQLSRVPITAKLYHAIKPRNENVTRSRVLC